MSTRLPGRPIDSVWEELDSTTRIGLATQLGHATAELHGLRAEPLARVCEPWSEFRDGQRARGVDEKRRKGLAANRVAEMEDFLQSREGVDDGSLPPLGYDVPESVLSLASSPLARP